MTVQIYLSTKNKITTTTHRQQYINDNNINNYIDREKKRSTDKNKPESGKEVRCVPQYTA